MQSLRKKQLLNSLAESTDEFEGLIKYPQIIKDPKNVRRVVLKQNELFWHTMKPTREEDLKSLANLSAVTPRDRWNKFDHLQKTGRQLKLKALLNQSFLAYLYALASLQHHVHSYLKPGRDVTGNPAKFGEQWRKGQPDHVLLNVVKHGHGKRFSYRFDYLVLNKKPVKKA